MSLALWALKPGPRVGTDGLGQYKMPDMQDSIRKQRGRFLGELLVFPEVRRRQNLDYIFLKEGSIIFTRGYSMFLPAVQRHGHREGGIGVLGVGTFRSCSLSRDGKP